LLLIAAAPALAIYAAAVLAACAVTAPGPARAALVPALTSDANELTAITVPSGWVESVSVPATWPRRSAPAACSARSWRCA
jgi:hypothetical protein